MRRELERTMSRIYLSIPLNGFDSKLVCCRARWTALLSIPLNGFLRERICWTRRAGIVSFNSIEWIPDYDMYVSLDLGSTSFNSIEWIHWQKRGMLAHPPDYAFNSIEWILATLTASTNTPTLS